MPSLEFPGGSAQFEKVARAFRQAEGELPRELQSALERAAPRLERAATASALENLPQAGGLAAVVAAAGMSTWRRPGGIRIIADGIDQLRFTNKGKVRHPVYGRPHSWITQSIPKATNWFTTPMREGAGDVRKELTKALNKIARRIA